MLRFSSISQHHSIIWISSEEKSLLTSSMIHHAVVSSSNTTIPFSQQRRTECASQQHHSCSFLTNHSLTFSSISVTHLHRLFLFQFDRSSLHTLLSFFLDDSHLRWFHSTSTIFIHSHQKSISQKNHQVIRTNIFNSSLNLLIILISFNTDHFE